MTQDRTIPRLGLGTHSRLGEDGLAAILAGIEMGYRHIDTAQTYNTEQVVGEALRRCALPREALFITTKVAEANLARDRFLPSLRESLDRLGIERVDLTLIHWASHRDAVAFEDYMGSLAEAKASGMTRLIGVSNFTIPLIEKSVALLGPGEVATNQVELHPYLQSRRLVATCGRLGVPVTAYMPLAKGRVATEPVLQPIAARHGATAAAICLAWLLQKDMIVIPASSKPEHMRSNLSATEIVLDAQEVAAIDALECNGRMINWAKSPVWDEPA